MRVDILVLFLISEEKLSVFYRLNMILTVFWGFFLHYLQKRESFHFKILSLLIFPLYHGLFRCIFDFQIFGDFPDIFALSGFSVNYTVGIEQILYDLNPFKFI